MIKDILEKGAHEFGVKLATDALNAFETYYRFLEEKNSVMDLTAISGEKQVAELHFLDSLALCKIASFKNKTVIDIGSGAGFPGLPLKLSEPSLSLTLLDAQRKRVEFLEELCCRLGLRDVVCMQNRAEEVSYRPELRDNIDIAVSRAVARLNILCELCLPFVKTEGMFIAMKGTDSDLEIRESEAAVKKLGAEIKDIIDYEIPETGIYHRLVVIRKKSKTPEDYPRRYARIQKKPL